MTGTGFEVEVLGPDDQGALEAFLLPRVDSSIFLLSNARAVGLEDRGGHRQGTYLARRAGDGIVGVVCHCWNGNLLLQAPGPELEALVGAARARALRPIKGVIGPAGQVARALRVVDPEPARIQLDEIEGLYRLALARLAVPAGLATGSLRGRRIEAGDVELLTAWQLAYALETLGDDDTPAVRAKAHHDVLRHLEEGITWVVTAEGRPVAMSSFNATLDDTVQIGGVYTPPGLRGNGYGRAAVATSLLEARDRGVERAVLFTGDANRAAIRAYRALGFEPVGDYRIVLLRIAAPTQA